MVQVNININDSLKKKFDLACVKADTTKTEVLHEAITKFVEANE